MNFPNNDPSDLAARAMVARNNNADLYVSIHINDNANTSVNGANVYVTSRTELPKYKEGMTNLGNKILNNISKLGIRNDGVISDKLCNDHEPKYQYYDGSQADYYADIRHAMRGDTLDDLGADFRDGSGIPTVLIEHCYINNSHDVQFLDSEEDLKKLAKADGDAIIDYLELRLKEDVVSNMTVDKESINLLQGESAKITASVGPDTALNKEIEWQTSDEKVATVDQQGNINSVGTGIAKITARAVDNPNVKKVITVNVEKEEVKFAKETENVLSEKTKKLEIKISPSWIENKNIVWESDNLEVVEVSQEGKITTKRAGTAKITATWLEKNLSDEMTINVIELPEDTKIEVNKYKVQDEKISNIGQKVKITDFLSNIVISDNLEIDIQTTNKNQEYIGTNTKVTIKEKQYGILLEEYECLIYGDINGDGKISAMDYTLIKNHIMDVKKITDTNMKLTADINGDNKISAMDYTLIKNDIMDVKKLEIK